MKTLATLSLLALSALSLYGQANMSGLRVVHASPDAPAVDVYVNGSRVIEALPYKEYTDYIMVPAGQYNVEVKVNNTDTVVLRANPSLTSGSFYTAMAVGKVSGGANPLNILLLQDDLRDTASDQIKLRIVHAAPSAPGVDIYVTSPFETLDGKVPVLTNVPFGAASPYLAVPARTYQGRVAVAGTKNVAINTGRLVTWPFMIRTIVAVDQTGGGTPFEIMILPDKN